MKAKAASFVVILSLLLVGTSGCIENYFNFRESYVEYEEQPMIIEYNISYGYWINITEDGDYRISYNCNLPDEYLAIDNYTSDLLYKTDYEKTNLVNNTMINWNITGETANNYRLGVKCSIKSKSFLVNDLNGENASSLHEIKTNYSDVFKKYCNKQVLDGKAYINPNNPYIKSVAKNITNKLESNNSFLLAKELFLWLKNNTEYNAHTEKKEVQTANYTFMKRKGDCDDLSFLYISICRSIGLPVRFMRGLLINKVGNKVTAIPHAWIEVFVGGEIGDGGWIPVECAGVTNKLDNLNSEEHQNFGVESSSHLRLFKDNGSNLSIKVAMESVVIESTGEIEEKEINLSSFVKVNNYKVLEPRNLVVKENNYRTYK